METRYIMTIPKHTSCCQEICQAFGKFIAGSRIRRAVRAADIQHLNPPGGVQRLLEVRIGPDPVRPAVRSHTAGKRPGAVDSEFPVPFEGPELFEGHPPHRAVGK